MTSSLITLLFFGLLVLFLAAGQPLVFIMGGLASLGLLIFFGPNQLAFVATQAYSQMDSFVTVAIPLFIFLGTLLEKSGIAEEAYDLLYKTLGRIKGGLAVASIIVCTIFGAMTGTAAAATVTMGVIALPQMLKHNYDKHISVGSVAAGGTLGVIIPPSVLMVLYGLFTNESIGKMFAGGVFAGIFLSACFCIYVLVRSYMNPNLCPAVPEEERVSAKEILKASKGIIAPIILIIVILGSIFGGIATPTEAAAIGCIGTLICTALRKTLSWSVLKETCLRTLELSAMVVWIIFASSAFTAFFTKIGAVEVVQNVMLGLNLGKYGMLVLVMIILIILGMFIDPGAIIMLTVPIIVPIMKSLGFDTLWFGVLFVCNMIIGYISPPFGFNLFYMRKVVPEGITMADIYKSVVPFAIIMALCLVVFTIFPQIILWLPNKIIK